VFLFGFKIKNYNFSKRFALKKIYCADMEKIRSIQQEIQILSQLENEFIIFYQDSFHDDQFFFILTEYCQVSKKFLKH